MRFTTGEARRLHDHHPPKYSVGIAVFAISAIVEVPIKVQVPVLSRPLFGWLFGKAQERAKENPVVRRVAIFLGVLVAGCGCGFAVNPSLDISQ